MSQRSLIATFTLVGSLACYYYGKGHKKDVVPYTMIGGFIGAIVGEFVSKSIKIKL